MATLKERAPQLFNVYGRDSEGRIADSPQGGQLVTGARIPSPVEVVNFILEAHHIGADNPAAIDIVNSLKELADAKPVPAPASTPTPMYAQPVQPSTPAPPVPSTKVTGVVGVVGKK